MKVGPVDGGASAGPSVRLEQVLQQVRACTRCAGYLPFAPRPVLRASVTARVLVVGQAPGRRVHETGIPWNDPSGDRLRGWLGMDRDGFYDASRLAIIPVGLCYPGTDPLGGDLPPRPECAPLWHPQLRPLLRDIRLTLLIGAHAQAYYLGNRRRESLAATVSAWREYGEEWLPLPHPSPRNLAWFKRHPWFEAEVVPELRRRVRRALEERND